MYDRAGGVHNDVKIPDAGDVITVPQEMEQSSATYESEDVSWSSGTTQEYLNQMWNSQGKKYSDEHWAYITVGGQERYLVALVPTYGVTGDYVDIYVTNNGTQTVYPCIIGDEKDIWVDAGYCWSDGVVYGHESEGKCNIIEVMSELSNNSSDWPVIGGTGILDRLKNVTKIVNGGNIKDYPNGPVGLSGSYSTGSGGDTEANTFVGAVGSFFRETWASICALFENGENGRSDGTVLYSFKNADSSYGLGSGNGDILASCEAVTKMLLARGCKYSLDTTNELISGDIDRQLNSGKYFCCATYVASVLYYAGVLTESQINKYNYHWTGAGGIPDMLKAAGWTQVSVSQAQPGDVVIDYEVHAMIYAGNGKVWDQTSAVTSSSGTAPTGTTRSRSISGCQVWRAP